jgi:hypothetical protein
VTRGHPNTGFIILQTEFQIARIKRVVGMEEDLIAKIILNYSRREKGNVGRPIKMSCPKETLMGTEEASDPDP